MYRCLIILFISFLNSAICCPYTAYADLLCQASKIKVSKNGSAKPPLKVAAKCPKGFKVLLDLNSLASVSVSVTDPLPSGKTITGVIGGDFQQDNINLGDWRVLASIPVVVPVILKETDVVIQKNEKVDNECLNASCLSDTEAAKPAVCTGSLGVPSAPPGKLCIYPLSSVNARSLRSFPVPLDVNSQTRGVSISWSVLGAGDTFFNAVWAYTAP